MCWTCLCVLCIHFLVWDTLVRNMGGLHCVPVWEHRNKYPFTFTVKLKWFPATLKCCKLQLCTSLQTAAHDLHWCIPCLTGPFTQPSMGQISAGNVCQVKQGKNCLGYKQGKKLWRTCKEHSVPLTSVTLSAGFTPWKLFGEKTWGAIK